MMGLYLLERVLEQQRTLHYLALKTSTGMAAPLGRERWDIMVWLALNCHKEQEKISNVCDTPNSSTSHCILGSNSLTSGTTEQAFWGTVLTSVAEVHSPETQPQRKDMAETELEV